MIPTTIKHGSDSGIQLPVPVGTSSDAAVALLGLSGSTAEVTKTASWNGHEFEVIRTKYQFKDSGDEQDIAHFWAFSGRPDDPIAEYSMRAYYPVDPRMVESDIAGATIAYPNADDSGWLFAHCDSDFHTDHEYRMLAAVAAVFEPEEHRADKVWRSSVYDCFLVNDRGNQAAVFAYSRLVHNLGLFRNEVQKEVIREARTRYLGYYQQNPHESHVSEPIERAIRAVIPTWNIESRRRLEWLPISTSCLLYTSPSPRDS